MDVLVAKMDVAGWQSPPRSNADAPAADGSPGLKRRNSSSSSTASSADGSAGSPEDGAQLHSARVSLSALSAAAPAEIAHASAMHMIHDADEHRMVVETVPVFTSSRVLKDALRAPTRFTDYVSASIPSPLHTHAVATSPVADAPVAHHHTKQLSSDSAGGAPSPMSSTAMNGPSNVSSSSSSENASPAQSPSASPSSSPSMGRHPTRPWLPSSAVVRSPLPNFSKPIEKPAPTGAAPPKPDEPPAIVVEPPTPPSAVPPSPSSMMAVNAPPALVVMDESSESSGPSGSSPSGSTESLSSHEVEHERDHEQRRQEHGSQRDQKPSENGDEESGDKTAVGSLRATARRKRRASIAVWSDPRLIELAQGNAPALLSNLSASMPMDEDAVASARADRSGLDALPVSIMVTILSYLSTQERLVNRRVCRRWLELLQSPPLAQAVDLTPLHKAVNDAVLKTIGHIYRPHLRQLVLRNCWHVSDAGVRGAVAPSPNVEVLDLNSCWELTDAGMGALAEACPSLKCIDLSNCKKMTDATISKLLASASGLEELKLSYCKSLTNATMDSIIRLGRNLRVVNLQRCTGVTDDGFAPFRDPAVPRSKLAVLVLSDCSFLTDAALESIAMGCPEMRVLNLSFCCALSPAGLEFLPLHCPRLETLDLSFCGLAVSDESVQKLTAGLPRLKKLSVRGCVQVTNAGLSASLDQASSLRMLNVSSCRSLDLAAVAVPPSVTLLPGNVPLENFDTLGHFVSLPWTSKPRRFSYMLPAAPAPR